ncbi:MAG: hypothetical protein AAF702_09145 [Chloroflexota bacterium]
MSSSNDTTNPFKVLRDNISFSSDEGRVQFQVTLNKAQLNQLLERADRAAIDIDGEFIGKIHQIDLIEPNIARVSGTFLTYPEDATTRTDNVEAPSETVEGIEVNEGTEAEGTESLTSSHQDEPAADSTEEAEEPTITIQASDIDGREVEGTLDIAFSAANGKPHAEIVDVNVPGLNLNSPAIQKINEKFAKEFVMEISDSEPMGVKSIQVRNDALSVAVTTPISDRWLSRIRMGKFALSVPSYSGSEGENYQWPAPWLPVINIRSKAKDESMPRVSIGLIAIGDVAIGLFAAGGVALGAASIGGISLGWWLAAGGIGVSKGVAAAGIALSQTVGLGVLAIAKSLSIGTLALSKGYAFGAVAAAQKAVGIISIGGVTFGVVAIGKHGWGLVPITADTWNAVKMFFGGTSAAV